MKRKAELETAIEQHGLVLKANNIGMNEPLTEPEGFPLSNIDVISIRKARHAIIYLQNDRKMVLKQIEKEMAELFEKEKSLAAEANMQQEQQQQPGQSMEVDNNDNDAVSTSLEPFAVVEKVDPGQLADRMGVQTQDKILRIGTLTYQNFKTLNQIQTIISNSQGSKIELVIRKANTGKDVTIDLDLGAPGTRLGIFATPCKK